jgi:putative ABC transport system permease protein
VRPPVGISALNRKLLRDLIAMKGQATAIALVVAAGIAMFVAYLSNFDSLQQTRRAYYDAQRFADVFANLTRAPERVRAEIAAIPGVRDAQTRVVAEVVLDVPGLADTASGRLVSIPSVGRPRQNDLFLRHGRWIAPNRPNEVLATEAFVEANGMAVGDSVFAIINGRRRELTIVGTALSPEYVYNIRPGEIVPDPRRFGVFWMDRRVLASAFDMEGGFNDVTLALERGALPDAVIATLDRLLEPYGGRGAIPVAQQLSNWTLESELLQLQTFGFFVPLIFLLVAAFVLNVALTRALALQRPQLAALKALGYTNAELAWHYLKWALAIAGAGGVLGVIVGVWMGSAMLQLYNEYFKFPVLMFRLSPAVTVSAIGISLGAAAIGGFAAVRRAVRISPAEAMRPESPVRYRHSLIETRWLHGHLTTTVRMIVRNLERQPVRALSTVVGIAFASAILQVGFSLIDAMDQLMVTQFSVAERQDLTLSFVEPLSSSARFALERLPGVRQVEPQRAIPVRLRAGHRDRTLAISGVPSEPELRRPVDRDNRVIAPPPEGLVLSAILARVLGVAPGDDVTVEVLEGRRQVRRVRVAAVVDDMFGIAAYMNIDALHRLVQEGATLSGAALLIDPLREDELSATLKRVPAVGAVASKRIVLENFKQTMAENMGVMLTFNVLFAGVIAFGVVYNAARVSLSERSRELASLRVLGFTRAEISLVLLGELAILTVAALPVGAAIGHGLTVLLVQSFESEIYRFPLVGSTRTMAWAALTVITASFFSGLVVRRRLDRLDLVGVLKLRE